MNKTVDIFIRMFEKAISRYSLVGNTTFFDSQEFSWIADLESNWLEIRQELNLVLHDIDNVPNYQEISEQYHLTQDNLWKTYFFYAYGIKIEKNCEECPKTTRLIEKIPGMKTAFFSILLPHKHLPEHRGLYKGVLRYHLGLIVPQPENSCKIRVGDDIAYWKEGKSLVFDDTYPHEAWNNSNDIRVVLFIDFIRPMYFPFSFINWFLIQLISWTPFVQDAKKRQDEWNKRLHSEKYLYLLLEQSNVARYEELTYPSFRPHLRKVAPENSKVAIGVELNSKPIGLIFAEYGTTKATPPKTFGEILSFFVVPEYRNKGIGTALLEKMSAELKDRGCEEISLKYMDNPCQIALEKILKRQNWLAPEATALIGYGSTAKIKNARIIKHLDRLLSTLPDDYTIFPWHTLTEADRDYIKSVMETHPLTRKFSPFVEEKKIEPLNSLGLRYKDKVVGWMINHRIAPHTIRYTQMYVHPDYKPLSQSILFFAKAIKLQCEAVPEVPNATARVEIDNTPMVNFVNRRLAPHLENIRHVWRVSKCL